MVDAISQIKTSARVLHRQVSAGDPDAIAAVRKLPEFKNVDDGALPTAVQRKHCLTAVARRLGFRTWAHASKVLGAIEDEADFGTLLYGPGCSAHFNTWFANYEEAQSVRAAQDSYLLPYKTQFVVVEDHFIRSLGLDPLDPDWGAIGRDWARPRDAAARARLYDRLVEIALSS